jgi:Fe-Mn family superoxide dismutase
MFVLPELEYHYDHLEPFIDQETMKIHHTKHHQTYINNLNKALGEKANSISIDYCISNVSKFSEEVRNNAGGHYNHSFFWEILTNQEDDKKISEDFFYKIELFFGSFEDFKNKFKEACLKRFGSGWGWLCLDSNNNFFISTTPNQDNPMMDIIEQNEKGTPIMGLDLWEHSYYLKYKNSRSEYIDAFWNVLSWTKVSEYFETKMRLSS